MEWIPVDASAATARARTEADAEDAKADQTCVPCHVRCCRRVMHVWGTAACRYLALLHRVASTRSFYFSTGNYDITHSVQRNDALACAASGSELSAGASVGVSVRSPRSFRAADDRFFWNAAGVVELAVAGADELITPMINGFVAQSHVLELGGMSLLLVSRRARTRQGTRFNMRGVDRDGNVANYAETEQIQLMPDGSVSAFVQTRGSVPLLWEQPVTMKYTPRTVLAADTAASYAAFTRHMNAQLEKYGRVTAVNLIDRKKDQLRLGEAYEKAATRFAQDALHYEWFDFHHECRNMKWHNLDKLLKKVATDMEQFGVYQRNASRIVVQLQRGVFRTNCMDNLDRTNVVQSLFARQAALMSVPGAMEKTKASGCSVLTSPFPEFELRFNNMWADNADALSRLYSGTGALKTDFTRTGKRTLMGSVNDGVNSVLRYVYNNLADGGMQDAWDLFLGRFVPGKHHHRGFFHHSHESHAAVAAPKSLVAPLKAHLRQPTPAAFFFKVFVVFSGVAALVAVFFAPSHFSQTARIGVGVTASALVLAGLSYLVVGKGVPFGRGMVSRPTFIREASLSASTTEQLKSMSAPSGVAGMDAGAHGGAADSPLSGRVKLA